MLPSTTMTANSHTGDTIRGEALMLLSVLGFTTMQGLTKYLGSAVSSWTKTFYRCVFTILFILIWIALNRQKIRFHNLFLLLVRGICGAFAITFYFWTIDLIDLLHGTLYVYAHPVFAVVFAALFYKERFPVLMILPLLGAVAGLFLIVNPAINGFGFGDLIGIVSTITAGLARATVRELRKSDTPEVIVIVHMSVSTIFTFAGILLLPTQSWRVGAVEGAQAGGSWIVLVSIGLISAISLILMTSGFRKLSTSVGSILQLLILPATAVVAFLVFHEPLTRWSIVGGILILVSSLAVTMLGNGNTARAK